MAEVAGFDAAQADQLALAVDEASTNVIEHAYRGRARPHDRAALPTTGGGDLRVEVVDDGEAVDPRAVPQVDLRRYASERRTGGLGMHLMGRIMDSVTFRRAARRNVCCMVKRKPAAGSEARAVTTPVVFQYQQALDEFRREGREPPLLKRMSELISLLDLSTTLGSTLSGAEILDAALLIVMGELQVSRGALYVAEEEGRYRRRAARGLAPGAPETIERAEVPERPFAPGPGDAALAGAGFALVCPVRKAGRPIALLGLGPRAEGRPFGPEETGFLESLAACAATPIENGLIYEELRRVNRTLSVKVYQLHNLFDIGRELTASLDEEAIERLVTTTVMGHFLASRCALYRLGPGGLDLAHARGVKAGRGAAAACPASPRRSCATCRARGAWPTSPAGPLRDALSGARFALVGAARGRGAAERPPRGGGAAGRPGLRRGGPRLRGRPGAPDPGRARGRAARTACASRRRGRTATCRSPAGSSRASSRGPRRASRASRWWR